MTRALEQHLDMRFLSNDKICIPVDQVIKLDPACPSVGRTFRKYRTQKDGQNGEEHQHTLNASAMYGPPCASAKEGPTKEVQTSKQEKDGSAE
jgi:hypothetical protein